MKGPAGIPGKMEPRKSGRFDRSILIATRLKFVEIMVCAMKKVGGVCQVFCVSFLEKILWGGEPPRLQNRLL